MAKIISIHSFRGGTGKSNTAANIATMLAVHGHRVGIVDVDIQSPGIHVLFGLQESDMRLTLNHFLSQRCPIEQVAHDVSDNLSVMLRGKVYLIPSSVNAGDIAQVVRKGYDVNLLFEGLRKVIDALDLEVLIIDTHPGLSKETLLSVAISDMLVIIMRPDAQDYQGTAVTVQVARQLDVRHMNIILNKVPPSFDFDQVRERVQSTYNCDVAAVLPHTDELMGLASEGVFVLRYPEHPLTAAFYQATRTLLRNA